MARCSMNSDRESRPRRAVIQRKVTLIGSLFLVLGLTLSVAAYAGGFGPSDEIGHGGDPQNKSTSDARVSPTSLNKTAFGFTLEFGSFSDPKKSLKAFKSTVDSLVVNNQKWIRVGISSWDVSNRENSEGKLQWKKSILNLYDAGISYARSQGLSVYLITADGKRFQSSQSDYVTDMRTYWHGLARRFGHDVSVWQIYNEADGASYSTEKPLRTLSAQYLSGLARMLQVGSRAIKSVNPHTLITTNASGWPVDDGMENKWEQFFDVVGPAVDVIGLDVYPAANVKEIEELPDRVQRIKKRYDKPVIIAEVGLQTCGGCWSEAEQGKYVSLAIDSLRRAKPVAIIVYKWRDTDGAFGVTRPDGSPKGGFHQIIKAMTS